MTILQFLADYSLHTARVGDAGAGAAAESPSTSGGSSGSSLSSSSPFVGLVLDSPFTSVRDIVTQQLRALSLPSRWYLPRHLLLLMSPSPHLPRSTSHTH